MLAERLRRDVPGLKVEINLSGGNFKNQFKKADRSCAEWAIIIAEEELTTQTISLKNLKREQPQQKLKYDELVKLLMEIPTNNR